jgi:hypothetical protein
MCAPLGADLASGQGGLEPSLLFFLGNRRGSGAHTEILLEQATQQVTNKTTEKTKRSSGESI